MGTNASMHLYEMQSHAALAWRGSPWIDGKIRHTDGAPYSCIPASPRRYPAAKGLQAKYSVGKVGYNKESETLNLLCGVLSALCSTNSQN